MPLKTHQNLEVAYVIEAKVRVCLGQLNTKDPLSDVVVPFRDQAHRPWHIPLSHRSWEVHQVIMLCVLSSSTVRSINGE